MPNPPQKPNLAANKNRPLPTPPGKPGAKPGATPPKPNAGRPLPKPPVKKGNASQNESESED